MSSRDRSGCFLGIYGGWGFCGEWTVWDSVRGGIRGKICYIFKERVEIKVAGRERKGEF